MSSDSHLNPSFELRLSDKHQKTLKSTFRFEGIGIFSGHTVSFTAKPADPDTGVLFINNDTQIPASIEFVDECPNRTRLLKDGASVQVVEHLLSALRGLEIDNAIVETEHDELPILDASAKDYTAKILEIGSVEQDARRQVLIIRRPIWLSDDHAIIALLPSDNPRITYILEHEHPQIRKIADSFALTPSAFRDFIGPARTFATREEASYMIEHKIVGTHDENLAIVIDSDGPNQKLRHPLEYVHHKMLDMIGDLSLIGPFIHAHLLGIRSGHAMNRALARTIHEQIKLK